MNQFERLKAATHGSAEWQAIRQAFLGASEAPSACGMGYQTRYSLYLEKTAEEPQLRPDSEVMLWGRLLEEPIAKEAAKRSGLKILSPGVPVQDSTHPWRIATPDFLVEDSVGVMGLLQIKTTGVFNQDNWADGPADGAHIQIAQEMAVTGAPYCVLAVLIGGQELRVFRVERDLELEQTVTKFCVEFWKCVETKTPPLVIGKDLELLNQTFSPGESVSLYNERLAADAGRWLNLKGQISELKESQDAIEARIKIHMQKAEYLNTGKHWVSWKGAKGRRFNIKEQETCQRQVQN